VHASLLPRWRGASPIEAAIESGDQYTGVTIMVMERGLDTGPILNSEKVLISNSETSKSLSKKLASKGAELLIKTIPLYIKNEITPEPQNEQEVTYAPMIKKSDGELDFSLPANRLERKIRAYTPWPGTFTIWNDTILKIHQASVVLPLPNHIKTNPGQRIIYEGKPAFITSEGLLVIERIQQAGRKQIEGGEFIRGISIW
jgi:methionyl-tRNA formyltransferase